MAALSLNVRYKPMSYDEYMRPFLMHQQAYENMVNNMDTLADEATKYSQYIQPGTKAYATQQQYLQQVQDLNNRIYNEGMSQNLNANNVRGLRRLFREQVAPINQAAQQLDVMNKSLNEMRLKNHHLLIDKMPTIDDMMNNPNSLPHLIDGQALQKDSMALAAAMAKELDSGSPIMTKHGYFIDMATRKGGTPEQKMYAYQNLLQSPYFQNLFKQYGINESTNPEVVQQALGYIKTGFAQGFVGETEHKMIEDPVAKAQLSLNNTIAAQNHQHQLQKDLLAHKTGAGQGNEFKGREGTINGISYDIKDATALYNSYPHIKYKKELDSYKKQGLLDKNYNFTDKGRSLLKTDSKFNNTIKNIATDLGVYDPKQGTDFNGDLFAVSLTNLHNNPEYNKMPSTAKIKTSQHVLKTDADRKEALSILQAVTRGSTNPTFYTPDVIKNGQITSNRKPSMDMEKLSKGVKDNKLTLTALDFVRDTGQVLFTVMDSKGNSTMYALDSKTSEQFLGQSAFANGVNGKSSEMWAGYPYDPKNAKTEFPIEFDYNSLINDIYN